VALGKVRSRGPELDIQGEILPGWNVIATWANTDVIVTETNGAGDDAGGLLPGDRLTDVPRFTASLWTTFEVQGSAFQGLRLGGGVSAQGSQSTSGGFSFFNQPPPYRFVELGGYSVVGLMAAYGRSFDKSNVTFQVNVDNLMNKRYYTSATRFEIDPSVQATGAFVNFGAPRTILASVSVEF
jgi:iron complex outermembrane receptor protein